MLDLIQIGAADACGGLLPIVKVAYEAIKLVMIIIPIALIVYGTIDLGKAVIASDEKEVKSAQSRLIKRFIYAAAIIFVPLLVGVVMNIVSAGEQGDTDSWHSCWQAATNGSEE